MAKSKQTTELQVPLPAELGNGAERTSADSAPISAESCGPAGEDAVTTELVVEAILFSADAPLSAGKLVEILGVGDARTVKEHVRALNEKFARSGASFRIEEVARGFQMLTLPVYNSWLEKLHAVRREAKLSSAAMETLAIVAYKQPVLRVDVESIRGVAVGDILNRLREMGLVKIVGRADIVGRPLQYGTTSKFLQVFGLRSLKDLPQVEGLAMPGQAKPGSSKSAQADDSGDESPAGSS
jgi:segregation and condensation protein B